MDILTIVDPNIEKKTKNPNKKQFHASYFSLFNFFLIFFITAGTYFAFLSTVISLCVECFILIFVSDKKRYCDTSHAENTC